MAENPPDATGASEPRFPPLPRWKKVVLSAASFLFVSGLVLTLMGSSGADTRSSSEASDLRPIGASNLTGGGPRVNRLPAPTPRTGPPDAENGALRDYSPALMKGGLSFLVGFSLAFALRAFVKISFIVLGVALLVLEMVATEGDSNAPPKSA